MEIGEKIIIALVVVVAVGVIGGAAIMIPVMEHEMHKPESCGANCHEMQPFYDSLMVTSHAEVDCHDWRGSSPCRRHGRWDDRR
jgi:nitrate/TMAO reductase-like tetraheme cytochrome c subunit